ncbi:hypothetical protein BJX63DRAFT_384047 [Aspergillus granulosus]|uniref:Uncharacterized protein n=1 Tax=Aspergillus granulosus TaxID=176169 RepID=A0ABR4HS75_9EURO
MVLSSEPEASCLPSGEKVTDITQSEWPSRVWCSSPVEGSQSLMVLSPELEASCLLSSKKVTDITQ